MCSRGLPHLDGEETFRELRRLQPNVRVLLMSGYNEQDAIARFVGKGLARFIQKPFNIEDFEDQPALDFELTPGPATTPSS